MVTICTASLTFSNSTFCPHSAFMCFMWISEQTAIISLYSINWLVFMTQIQCVYCAVRTGYLNVIQVDVSLYWAVPFFQFCPVTRLTLREVTDYLGEHSSNVPGTPQLYWCAQCLQLWYLLKIQVLLIVTPCRLVHSLLPFLSVIVALYAVLSRPRSVPVYKASQPRWLWSPANMLW